jgi:DNA-binding PadR family transcriptional regulator
VVGRQQKQVEILQGTLNMMILQALQQGPANGYEIAKYTSSAPMSSSR